MTDIIITPTNPISGVWDVKGVSQEGKDWLQDNWGHSDRRFGPAVLAAMKRQATADGLTFETDFSNIRTLKVDP